MALFPSREHKVYNYTFLLNTFTSLFFAERNAENCSEAIRQSITEFLHDCFGLLSHNYPFSAIHVTRGDSNINYLFAPDETTVRVNRAAYHSFGASLLPEASKLRRFVYDVLLLDHIDRVEVRKISIFPIQITEDVPTSENVNSIISQILSDKIMSLATIKEIDNISGAVAPFSLHLMQDYESGYWYEIVTGLMKDTRMKDIYNVVFDARCSFKPDGGIVSGDLERTQIEMNQKVYELFHWAVRDHVIEVMGKEVVSNGQ